MGKKDPWFIRWCYILHNNTFSKPIEWIKSLILPVHFICISHQKCYSIGSHWNLLQSSHIGYPFSSPVDMQYSDPGTFLFSAQGYTSNKGLQPLTPRPRSPEKHSRKYQRHWKNKPKSKMNWYQKLQVGIVSQDKRMLSDRHAFSACLDLCWWKVFLKKVRCITMKYWIILKHFLKPPIHFSQN